MSELKVVCPHCGGESVVHDGSDALIAQARAEERAYFIEDLRQQLAEEAARVARVIAEVREQEPADGDGYGDGWRAACDAIEARLEGGSDAG